MSMIQNIICEISKEQKKVVLYKIRGEKVGEENVWETSQIPLKSKWLQYQNMDRLEVIQHQNTKDFPTHPVWE